MPLQIPDRYRSFFEASLQQWAPGCKYALIRSLDSGRSSAVVYVIDIAHAATGKPVDVSGQYILKLQEKESLWDPQSEYDRHKIASERNASFAANHIPGLVRHAEDAEHIGILYEIAGYSLATVVAADTVQAGAIQHYGREITNKLLTEFNSSYEVELEVSAQSTLESWLGYRLDAKQAPTLHDFVAQELGDQPVTIVSGRLMANPLWLCTCDAARNSAGVRFSGLIHGDLHPGNIMVDRQSIDAGSFWLIDFALSRQAPLFYDHAYLELALLLNHLDGHDRERIIGVLDALDEPPAAGRVAMVPVADSGLVECVRSIRGGADTWQITHEQHRRDTYAGQQLLAQVAAALNWANKPLSQPNRSLSLAYGCWAASKYLRTFVPDVWSRVIEDAENRAGKTVPAPLIATGEAPSLPTSWSVFWEQCARFDEGAAVYVLITGTLHASPDLSALGLLPWTAVVDFDPSSDEQGLFSFAAPELAKLRSVHQYGKRPQPLDAERGTAWLMAGGWPSHLEPIPQSLSEWRRGYMHGVRDLFSALKRATAPRPIRVVVLSGTGLDAERLTRVLEIVDEELQDAAQILLLGAEVAETGSLVATRIDLEPAQFASCISVVYGKQAETVDPELPGASGPVRIPIDRLRNWEEDLDVLHSRILIDAAREAETDEFWRGHPPSWADLHSGADVQRFIHTDLVKALEGLLTQSKSRTLELHHLPGAGGTTAALRAVFSLRNIHPTVILRRSSRLTVDRIDQVFQLTQRPVLVLAESAELSPSAREDLYRGLASRNSRAVILYVVRSTAADQDREFALTYPMEEGEAKEFGRVFAARTKDNRKKQQFLQLARATEPRYICPFFFGLTLHAQSFTTVDRYVSAYLEGAPYGVQKLLRYIAMVTRFSQVGIEEALLRQFVGLRATSSSTVEELLGNQASRLILTVGKHVRALHPLIAEEMLKELLGGSENWRDGLKDLALDFIKESVGILGPESEYLDKLFTSLFIRRDEWLTLGLRSNFSELIRAVPTKTGQHQIFQLLTDLCPNQPHFWNHLGRHHIYEMQHDYETADTYLKRAVALAPLDSFHHHSLGMVLRFWVRDQLREMIRNADTTAPIEMLRQVRDLTARASECFARTRELGPEDDHGYITHMQMILEVSERLIAASGAKSMPELKEQRGELARWIRSNTVMAEDLLARVAHMRAEGKPSRFEIRCGNRLMNMYGDFLTAIKTWESLLTREDTEHGSLRRAVVSAYYCKAGRLWSGLDRDELTRVSELMDQNLSEEPANDRDVRVWFQAYKRLPEFSYLQALDRLEAWAARSDSLEAHYYCYVLHFLLWRGGISRGEADISIHLDRCKDLATGRRGHSYEWLATEPLWCPLIGHGELGGFNRRKGFYNDPSKLAEVTGIIEDMKGPQAGVIRIGEVTRAFFVPGTEFWESQHINAVVHFHLGFAYAGLRAWKVSLGRADVTAGGSKTESPQHDFAVQVPAPIEDANKRSSGGPPQREEIVAFISDLLRAPEYRDRPLYVSVLGNKLLGRFPGLELGKKRGHMSAGEFVNNLGAFVISGSGLSATVRRRSAPSVVLPGVPKQPPDAAGKTSSPNTPSRADVAAFVRECVLEMEREGRPLFVSQAGFRLGRKFPGIPIQRRFGFERLSELLSTLEGITLRGEGERTTVYLKKATGPRP